MPRNSVILYKIVWSSILIFFIIDLPTDIVPATFKKKKTAAVGGARVKGDDNDEKPGRPEEETTGRPTGLGRGSR